MKTCSSSLPPRVGRCGLLHVCHITLHFWSLMNKLKSSSLTGYENLLMSQTYLESFLHTPFSLWCPWFGQFWYFSFNSKWWMAELLQGQLQRVGLVYRLSYNRGSPSVGVHLPSLHYFGIKGACILTSLFTLFQFLKYVLCCAHDSILTCDCFFSTVCPFLFKERGGPCCTG